MTNLSLLKQQVQIYSEKVNALTEITENALKKANETFKGDLYLEKSKEINTQYRNTKDEYKVCVLEALSEVVSEFKEKLEGESTSTATSEAMNDITVLQLIGIINESELKVYAEKYKEYPMILSYLKQIGEQNGYYLDYKNIDDANKIIESLEMKTKDLLENYAPSNVSYDHRVMLLDEGGYYDMIEKSLNDFIEDTVVIVTKISVIK